MNFTKSIEVCFNKFANFEGRARKSEFWWFQLFCIIVQIVGMILDSLLGYTELFYWIGYIIVYYPLWLLEHEDFMTLVDQVGGNFFI